MQQPPESKHSGIILSMMVWFLATILLAAIFIGSGLQGEFTTAHMIFASIVLGLATIATPLVIYATRDKEDIGKLKRQRIDTMLQDMSDDELLELKKRLSDGDYNEESLLEYVSDDGELVFRN